MAEIEENGFNLNISRYVSTAEPEEQVDLDGVYEGLVSIEENIRDARGKHNGYLEELGLPSLP